jgi:hypothetical protein
MPRRVVHTSTNAWAARIARWLVSLVLGLGTVLLLGGLTPSMAVEFILKVGDLQVPAGTVVHGDAIAVGGSVYVDGTVEGDAAALGGNVDVRGHVGGAARAAGGSVILRPTAVVDGEATAVGGEVRQEPGASVGGTRSQPGPSSPPSYRSPGPPSQWWPGPWLGALFMAKALFWFLYLLTLASFISSAWLVAVLFPRAVARLAEVIEREPVTVFGAGLLGWPLSLALAFLLILSLVGLTLVLLVPVALVLAVLFGTTAIAFVIGRRIRPSGVAQDVIVGAVLLAIGFSIPRAGGLLALVVATVGLGSVLVAFVEGHRSRHAPPPPPPASLQQT